MSGVLVMFQAFGLETALLQCVLHITEGPVAVCIHHCRNMTVAFADVSNPECHLFKQQPLCSVLNYVCIIIVMEECITKNMVGYICFNENLSVFQN
jgi:hypothetical protein